MPQNKAHGSKTLADLSPDEVSRLYATIRSKVDNSGLARNLAPKYGLSMEEVLSIARRIRNRL